VTAITEKRIQVNGVPLWTAVQGQEMPVVLCHGGPEVYDYLGPVAGMIDDIATVYRYDQRGCGRSEHVLPYDVETFVEELDGLREHWGLDTWVVGGHSWGAELAIAYAVSKPHRVSGLLSLSGTGVDDNWHEEYHRNRAARLSPKERERLQYLDRSETPIGAELDAVRKERLALLARTELFDPSLVERAPKYDAFPINYDQNAMMGKPWEGLSGPEEFVARVSELRMPALIVYGEGDPRPRWTNTQLTTMLPDGRFVEVPRAGHDIWVERPERLRPILRRFIGELA